jgi:hypothetical protein
VRLKLTAAPFMKIFEKVPRLLNDGFSQTHHLTKNWQLRAE